MAKETIKKIAAAMVLIASSAVAWAYAPISGYRIYSDAVTMGDDGEATVTLLMDNSEAIKRAFHVEVVVPEGYYFKMANNVWATAQGGIGTVDQQYDKENRLLRLLFTSAEVVPAGTGRAIATLRLAVDPESEAATPGRVMTVRNFTFVRAADPGGHNGVDASVTVKSAAAQRGDINGDGIVDVADLTMLIDVVLGKRSADSVPGNCHVAGNTGIDVADVSALIDIVLGK